MEFNKHQSALLPELDSKTEVTRVDTIHFEEAVCDPKPEVEMSAQRKRRAQRMARRPQRLALGPASEHAAEITRAIQLIEAKNGFIDGADLEVDRGFGQKSPTIEARGTDGVQSNKEALSEDDACLIAAHDDPNTGDRSTSEAQTSLSASDTEGGEDHTEGDDRLFPEIVPAEDQCRLEATQPDTQSDHTEVDEVPDAAQSIQLTDVTSQTPSHKEQDRPEAIDSPPPESGSGEVSVNVESLSGSSVNQAETIIMLSLETVEDETVSTEAEAIVIWQDEDNTEMANHDSDDLLVATNKFAPKEGSVPSFSSAESSALQKPENQVVVTTIDQSLEFPDTNLTPELTEVFPDLKEVSECHQEPILRETSRPLCEAGDLYSQAGSISDTGIHITTKSYRESPAIPPRRNVDEAVIKMIGSKAKCPSLTTRDLSTFDMGKRVKNLNNLEEIGRGSYGRVLMARHTQTNTPLAIKQPMRSENYASPGEMVDELKTTRTRSMKEGFVHQLVSNSPFFPKFWGTLDTGNDLCLAVQFVGDHQSRTSYPLLDPPKLSATNGLDIAEDVVRGMMELHSHGLLHNDLKSDNVLLENRGKRHHAVIIDFGMVSTITSPLQMTGLPGEIKMAYIHGEAADYLAPEIVLGEEPTSISADVYSVGRLLIDIAQIAEAHRSRSHKALNKLSDLGFQCMKRDPDARPSLDDLLSEITALKSSLKRVPFWRRLFKKF